MVFDTSEDKMTGQSFWPESMDYHAIAFNIALLKQLKYSFCKFRKPSEKGQIHIWKRDLDKHFFKKKRHHSKQTFERKRIQVFLGKNRGNCDLGRIMSHNIIKARILRIFYFWSFLTFRIQDIIKFWGLGKLLSFRWLTGSETFSKLYNLSVPQFLFSWYIALHILEGLERLNEFLDIWGLEQSVPDTR